MKWVFFLVLFSSIKLSLHAQKADEIEIKFYPKWNNNIVELDTYYKLSNTTDSITLETIKFYISGIELLNNDSVVYTENNSYHLIDLSNPTSLVITLHGIHSKVYNHIRFQLGIDSLTNTSGAMGGDLDPTKGMYWTWQNGYINIKMEGKSNRCKTKNNAFEFHLGGYQFPFNSMQTILLKCKNQLEINVNMDGFFNQIDIAKTNQIMSPNAQAMLLSEYVSKIFAIK